MSLPRTLVASPSGLWHFANVLPAERSISRQERIIVHCTGNDANMDTWTRYSDLDQWMFSKGPRTIGQRVEGNKCSRCFPGS